jgi:hypothetical protein
LTASASELATPAHIPGIAFFFSAVLVAIAAVVTAKSFHRDCTPSNPAAQIFICKSGF